MRRRRWPWFVLAVALLLFVAKHFLLDTAVAATSEYTIDLAALHRAATNSGPLPDHIEVEQIGTFSFPRTLVVAGDGFSMQPMVLLAHRVVWPDRTVVIDTAMTPADVAGLPGAASDASAYARLERALERASTIVFTHEHVDHVGGLGRAPNLTALVKHVQLTREQLESPKLERDRFAKGTFERFQPLDYQGLYAVAPGVVLQKAPGHSPGSQLIYVELRSGQRFLFVGDIAWNRDNIRLQRGRPGLATLLMQEDRAAVAAQVQALAHLPADVHVVLAHDPSTLAEDLRAGLFQSKFRL